MTRLRQRPWQWTLVPLLFGGLARAVRSELARTRYDAVHCHWLVPQGTVQAGLFAGPGRPPFVVTSHGGDVALARHRWLRPWLRATLDRAAAVTVVAPAMVPEVQSLCPGMSPGRVTVIPMGVDLDRFRPGDVTASNEAPRVLFVGRLVEKKGLEHLLRALATPPLLGLSATLDVAGEGPLEQALRSLAQQLGLGQRVRFLGAVPHLELPARYARSDVFCLPSVVARDGDRDGLPTVLCEAAACGLPLVASDVAGTPLLVRTGETGSLLPPGDVPALAGALHELLADPRRRRELGEAARRRARLFAWGRTAEAHAEILRRVVREPRPARDAVADTRPRP